MTQSISQSTNQAIATELIFHYLDGRNESFTIYESIPFPSSSLSLSSDLESSVTTLPASSPSPVSPTAERLRQDSTTPDPFHHHLRRLLGQDWWVLQLPEKSVVINMSTVVKVEIRPPLPAQANDIVAQVDHVGQTLLNAIQDV